MATKFQFRFCHAPVRFRSALPSRTRSEFRADCDIRNIIMRHSMAPSVAPAYVDMTVLPDGVQGILEFARTVAADFDSLPLKARERFNYDSSALVAFLMDEGNRDEAIKLGLLPASSTPVSVTTPVSTIEEKSHEK